MKGPNAWRRNCKKDAGSDETGLIIFHVYSISLIDHPYFRIAYGQIPQHFFHLRIMIQPLP